MAPQLVRLRSLGGVADLLSALACGRPSASITGQQGDSPKRLNDSATQAHRPQRAAELRRRDRFR